MYHALLLLYHMSELMAQVAVLTRPQVDLVPLGIGQRPQFRRAGGVPVDLHVAQVHAGALLQGGDDLFHGAAALRAGGLPGPLHLDHRRAEVGLHSGAHPRLQGGAVPGGRVDGVCRPQEGGHGPRLGGEVPLGALTGSGRFGDALGIGLRHGCHVPSGSGVWDGSADIHGPAIRPQIRGYYTQKVRRRTSVPARTALYRAQRHGAATTAGRG